MELTVNTFTKGLLIDTNPMIQGTDTLTDALNATITTMNGNEIILLNDMGNRRVADAYLPAGFEPVGIKEYGGIIYVAAYNPITNLSQIGSFPSPLRKYSNSSNETKTLSFSTCSCTNDWVNTLPELFPLLKTGEIIHVGDKFAILTTNNETFSGYVSNYKNTTGNKVTSPKNKLFTLSVGVLNENGIFYDITDKLVRWEVNDNKAYPKEYSSNTSELFKFNDEYFIAEYPIKAVDSSHGTIADNNLTESRFITDYANTYSEKFVGPLYLRKLLNYILEFTYDLQAIRDDSNNLDIIKITINGILKYNCPDGCGLSLDDDETYESFYTDTTNNSFSFFDFYINKNKLTSSSTSRTVTYDKISNLYTANVIKKYTLAYDDYKSFDYDIKVLANSNCNCYVKEISSLNNHFDATLINSNTLNLLGWRFKNSIDNRETELTYVLEAYPSKNVKFTNLNIIFKNVDSSRDLENARYISNLSVNNGINIVRFNWDDVKKKLEPNQLYEVTLYYLKMNSLTGEILEASSNYGRITPREDRVYYIELNAFLDANPLLIDEEYYWELRVRNRDIGSFVLNNYYKKLTDKNGNKPDLWLLTTELLNDCYTTVNNFCEVTSSSPSILANEEIKNKLKIKYNIKLTNISSSLTSMSESYIGKPVATSSGLQIDYMCKHKVTFTINGSYEVDFNKRDFPEFLSVDTSNNNISISATFYNDIIELFRGQILRNYFLSYETSTVNNIVLDTSNHTFNTSVTVVYYDCLTGSATLSLILKISKAAISLEEKLNILFPISDRTDFVTPSLTFEKRNNVGPDVDTFKPVLLMIIKGAHIENNSITNDNVIKYRGDNVSIILPYIVSSTTGLLSASYSLNRILTQTSAFSARYRLCTYLSPNMGNHLGNYTTSNQAGSEYKITYMHGNTPTHLYTEENNIVNGFNYTKKRFFIKTKINNNIEWQLVKYNNKFYIDDNSDLLSPNHETLNSIKELFTTFNGYNVYIYTNLNSSIEVTVYYPNNLLSTNDYDNINPSLKLDETTDINSKIIINKKNPNGLNITIDNSFTRSLGKTREPFDILEIPNINGNCLNILEGNMALFILGKGSLGSLALKDNEVVLLDNLLYDDNKYYYYKNGEFIPLNSSLSLEGEDCFLKVKLNDINSLYENLVYDKYERNQPYEDNPSALPLLYSIKLLYDSYIDLTNFNVYLEI